MIGPIGTQRARVQYVSQLGKPVVVVYFKSDRLPPQVSVYPHRESFFGNSLHAKITTRFSGAVYLFQTIEFANIDYHL